MPTYCYLGNDKLIGAVESRLAEAGYERIEQVGDADFVVTFFTSMTVQEDAYFGDDGLVQAMKKEAVAVDLSASTPNLSSEICAVAAVNDICMVSAPMTVKNKLSEDAFRRSNTSCYAGSEDDGVERARELLDVLFGDVRIVADAGAAQLARAARTIQNTAEMVAAIEALALFDACSKSVSSNIDVKTLAPNATSPEAYFIIQAVKNERFFGDYTVEMLMSEISAAMMTADDYEVILPQTEAAFHLYELLAIIGGSDMSPAALSLVFEGEKPAGKEGDGGKADLHGLDWSRAASLYSDDEHDHVHDQAREEDEYDFGYDDLLDAFGDELPGDLGYSMN